MRLYLSSFRIGNRPEELIQLLAGGKRTALIVNADDYKTPEERAASLQHEIEELEGLGLEPIEIDLRTYFGKADEVREALAPFNLMYVRGGNAFVLRRAFRQSGLDEILPDLLARDAIVYGGYSAGPCMLGPTLRGLESREDDPNVVPVGYESQVIWECLNILPFAIAPHYQGSTADATGAITFYVANNMPFIALRDGEAIVVDGERQTIVG